MYAAMAFVTVLALAIIATVVILIVNKTKRVR